MNLHRNQFSKRCSTVKPAEARGHTAYCALTEPSLTALKVAEDATSAGLMLPNEREFMCCARQPHSGSEPQKPLGHPHHRFRRTHWRRWRLPKM